MMTLIIGGSGSGKSEYAERLIEETGKKRRIYVAAMVPQDKECIKKIERHRQLRAERGFETAERYSDLAGLKLNHGEQEEKANTAVLLECLSNLIANEMYWVCPLNREKDVASAVIKGIENLLAQAGDLVVVTNDVFSDGAAYGRETQIYMRTLGRVSRLAAGIAGRVVEVSAGHGLVIKE